MTSVIFAEKNHDSHEHHGHAVHQNDVYVDGNKFKLDKKRFDEFKKNLKLNIRYANSINRIRKHASEQELGLNSGQFSSLVSFAFMYQISRWWNTKL